MDEGHPTDPISPYGIQKLTLEKCIEYYGRIRGLDYLILRITNPYGMYQDPGKKQGAIAVFLARAILVEPIEIWGDGNAVLAGAWKKVFDEIPNADEASAPNPDQRVVQELLMQEIWKEEE